jgi:aminoglycoside/choline kinase family phosphotransferase
MSPTHSPEPSQPESLAWPDTQRQADFNNWLSTLESSHGLLPQSLRSASADASFRRYFRIDSTQGSRIIMDAPPDKEDCRPFAKVAHLMQEAGLHAPQVLAWDEARGFMLLSDLGAQTMMQVMQRDDPWANQTVYLQAVDALIKWQLASRPDVLPTYDTALLRRELELFPEWYLTRHRGVAVEGDLRRTLDESFERIIQENLRWPSVFVHRDFMPRNLMISDAAPTLGTGVSSLPPTRLGVLDFQDAVYGPITYDIASLMRDAFLSWDEDFCLDITIRYWERARKAGLPVGNDFGDFYRGVEWMGLQRHLKVAGIFARLTLRDGKPQYLADTPRFITYLRATCERYRELKPLLRLIERAEGIVPVSGYVFGRS